MLTILNTKSYCAKAILNKINTILYERNSKKERKLPDDNEPHNWFTSDLFSSVEKTSALTSETFPAFSYMHTVVDVIIVLVVVVVHHFKQHPDLLAISAQSHVG